MLGSSENLKIVGVKSLKKILITKNEYVVWLSAESNAKPETDPFSAESNDSLDITDLIKNSEDGALVINSKQKFNQLILFDPGGGLSPCYFLKLNVQKSNFRIPNMKRSFVLLDSSFSNGDMFHFKLNNPNLSADFYSKATKNKNGDIICECIRIENEIYFITLR